MRLGRNLLALLAIAVFFRQFGSPPYPSDKAVESAVFGCTAGFLLWTSKFSGANGRRPQPGRVVLGVVFLWFAADLLALALLAPAPHY